MTNKMWAIVRKTDNEVYEVLPTKWQALRVRECDYKVYKILNKWELIIKPCEVKII